MSEADSYIAKWLAREPEMELAQVFCPASERPLFALWGALLNEFDEAVFELNDNTVAQTKLAWWSDELARGAQGSSRHPLLRDFFLHDAARRIEPARWQVLGHAAIRLAADESTPSDTAAALTRHRHYSEALARIESALFGVVTPAEALALHPLLRQWPQGEATSTLRWPLQLLARHQIGAGEMRSESAVALRRDFAAELLALQGKNRGGALFRRCRSALDAGRLRQLAAGRSATPAMGRWRALWLLWRAARASPAGAEASVALTSL